MFKIPDWEEDIPKNKVKFIKPAPKEKNKTTTSPSIKENTILKPKLKSQKNTISKKVLVNHVKQSKIGNNINTPELKNNIKKVKKTIENASEQIENEKATPNKIKKTRKKDKTSKKIINNIDTDNLICVETQEKLNQIENGKIESKSKTNEEFTEVRNKKSKDERKKELIKSLLQKESNRTYINISNSNPLRERMLERLKAAKFRFLNEKLYTSTGSDAQKLFEEDPTAFKIYHEGYQQQMKKWPVKPLDIIINRIQKMPKSYVVADMGCGEAELSRRVAQRVQSFDLVASAPGVHACDVTRTPLRAAEVDVAVYCLALMGAALTPHLLEAARVLRQGGHLLIAEVESRFDNVDDFVRDVQKLGFSLKKLDKTHKVFYFMEFTKIREPPVKKSKLPFVKLKPCIYKKR